MLNDMEQRRESVAVVGAGALGLMYAELLQRAGVEVYFLADGERVERIAREEYWVNGKGCRFSVRRPEEMAEPAAIVIVAVKNHHLDSILPLLGAAVGAGTILVSVLNGISSELFLRKQLPAARVPDCVALGMDAVKEGAALSYTSSGRLLLGFPGAESAVEELSAALVLFSEVGMAYELPEDSQRALWWKWMINIGVNQVSAVTGAPYRLFQEDAELRSLMDEAMQEVVAVAEAEGIDLHQTDIRRWYEVLNSLGPEGKTSMLQDIEAERKTEVEAFSGELISLAERHGLDVPVNRALFRILRTLEKRSRS